MGTLVPLKLRITGSPEDQNRPEGHLWARFGPSLGHKNGRMSLNLGLGSLTWAGPYHYFPFIRLFSGVDALTFVNLRQIITLSFNCAAKLREKGPKRKKRYKNTFPSIIFRHFFPQKSTKYNFKRIKKNTDFPPKQKVVKSLKQENSPEDL